MCIVACLNVYISGSSRWEDNDSAEKKTIYENQVTSRSIKVGLIDHWLDHCLWIRPGGNRKTKLNDDRCLWLSIPCLNMFFFIFSMQKDMGDMIHSQTYTACRTRYYTEHRHFKQICYPLSATLLIDYRSVVGSLCSSLPLPLPLPMPLALALPLPLPLPLLLPLTLLHPYASASAAAPTPAYASASNEKRREEEKATERRR